MYYFLTNMNEDDDILNDDVYASITRCGVNEFKSYIRGDIIMYYALYNEPELKLATYKENEWLMSNEFKVIEKQIDTLENSARFISCRDIENRLPMKDRTLTTFEQNKKIEYYINNKWLNELGWNND